MIDSALQSALFPGALFAGPRPRSSILCCWLAPRPLCPSPLDLGGGHDIYNPARGGIPAGIPVGAAPNLRKVVDVARVRVPGGKLLADRILGRSLHLATYAAI